MSVTAFRSEITDTVKALFELNKLKIVLASGLLAVAFGIGSSSKIGDFSYLTLTLVPFTCLYIDFQYYHCLAKIFVLARFLSESEAFSGEAKVVKSYEEFVDRIRETSAPGLFSFESKAQLGSSLLLSVTCPILGIVALLATTPSREPSTGAGVMLVALAISVTVGSALIVISFLYFKRQMARMRRVPVFVPEPENQVADATEGASPRRDNA